MTEKPVSLSRSAWGLVGQEIGKLWPTGLNVFFITIAILAVGVWVPSSLFFTIPLLLMSFLFAYQLTASYIRKNEGMGNKQFLSFFSAYFRMPFFGCYRIIRNAFISVLYSVGSGLLVAILYYVVASNISPAFASDWSALTAHFSANELDAANSLISSSAALAGFEQAVAYAEGAGLFFAFSLLMSFYGLSPYLRSIIMGATPRICNAIFVGGIRKARGFWRDYCRTLWPLLVAEILGFALGSAVAYWISRNSTYLVVGGVSGALIFLTPLFPYYFEAAGLLMEKYRRAFSDFSISFAQQTLEKLEANRQMSEEEAKEIKKTIDEAKKLEEENPPLPPLDDGTHQGDNSSDDEDDNDDDHR
jgi:hypothetical protein